MYFNQRQVLFLEKRHAKQCEDYEKVIAALNNKVELSKNKSQLFTEYTIVRKKLIDANRDNGLLKKQLHTLTADLKRAENVFATNEKLLKKQLTEAKDESSKHMTKWKDAEDKIKLLQAEKDILKYELTKAKEEISDLGNKNSTHIAKLKHKDQELQTQGCRIRELNGEMDVSMDHYNRLVDTSEAKDKDILKLKKDLEDIQEHHQLELKMGRKVKVLPYTVKWRPTSIMKPEPTQIRELKKDIVQKDKEVTRLYDDCQKLRAETAQAVGQYENCRVELRKAKDETHARTADRDVYSREVDRLKDVLSDVKRLQKKQPISLPKAQEKEVLRAKSQVPNSHKKAPVTKAGLDHQKKGKQPIAGLVVMGRRLSAWK